MPISLICRRCGTELHQGDAFCQECGLKCPGADLAAEKNVPPASAATGSLAKAFARATFSDESETTGVTTAVELPSFAAMPASASAAAPSSSAFSLGASSSATRLNSPLFKKAEHPELSPNNLGWRGGWHIVLSDLAAIAAVIAFAVLLANFAINTFKKDQQTQLSKQVNDLSKKFKDAAAKREYKTALQGLVELKATRPLNAREQALLDESAFRLGQEELAKGERKNAIDHLKQVSVLSDYYVGAQETLFNMILPAVQPAQAVSRIRNRRSHRIAAAAPLVDQGAAASLSTSTSLSTSSTTGASSSASTAPGIQQSVQLSDEPVLSIPSIPEIESRAGNNSDGDSSAEKPEASPLPKFSESEISKYNHLLGAYFSRRKATKSGNEPPSFKEWIKDGKPSF